MKGKTFAGLSAIANKFVARTALSGTTWQAKASATVSRPFIPS